MTIRRTAARAYTDDSPVTSNSICNFCYDDNITVKLEKYIMIDGREDPAYRQCPECHKVISKNQQKHKGEIIALGNTNNSGEPIFLAVNSRRGRGLQRDSFEQDVPKFTNNMEDTELKQMVADGAIILSIEDELVGYSDGDQYNE